MPQLQLPFLHGGLVGLVAKLVCYTAHQRMCLFLLNYQDIADWQLLSRSFSHLSALAYLLIEDLPLNKRSTENGDSVRSEDT